MEQGIVLMVIGMATVFGFLVLLVVAMQLSANFFKKFSHLFPEAAPAASKAPVPSDETTQIAVALAAIRAQRG
jgi:sodium pump decarboxylase gamma subunit